MRKPVVIRANGITYRGVLIEVAPEEIVLRTATSQVSIPMSRITSVADANARVSKEPNRFVDPSYYKPEEP